MSTLRLLWSSPLPPTRSGVADYATEVLPHLSLRHAVRVVEPPGWQPPSDDPPWRDLPRVGAESPPDPDELAVLHLGNNPYHLWVARRLRRWGGIVVLHDTVLHHLLVEEAADDDDWERFAGELTAAHGEAGSALAAARAWGYTNRLAPFLFPARTVYLERARGVIVHSRCAERAVAGELPGVPLRRVPLAVGVLPARPREEVRRAIAVGNHEVLLAHIGFLTPAKGLGVIVNALAALRGLGVPVRLVVVGEGEEESGFTSAVRAAGLEGVVSMMGYADAEGLGGVVAAADLGLVPRFPTAGETSAAVLRFLAAGTPVAVAGYRQFLEFPAAAAQRIQPGAAGMVELVRTVQALAGDPARRAEARTAARQAWEAGGHEPQSASNALAEALESLA